MNPNDVSHSQGTGMIEAWQHWEGYLVDSRFPLLQCLAGTDNSALFSTEIAGSPPRRAAIKLIQADPETADRSLARWRSVAGLSHPHLLPLIASGTCPSEEGVLLYVVTGLADESLALALIDRPLSTEEARETLGPLLDALAYLHAKGYAHTALKPTHILATSETVQLTIDRVRPFGQPAGSSAPSIYDAPELAETGPSAETDIWALGVLLSECLTQAPPTWEQIENIGLPVDSLPQPFAEITRGCLQRDPRQRWSLSDIEARLRKPATTETVASPPTRPTSRLRSYGLAAALILGFMAVLAGSRFFGLTPETESTSVPTEASAEPPAPEPAPSTPPARVEPEPSPAPVDSATSQEPAPAAPSEASTPAGELTAGQVTPGQVVRQVLPDVPIKASNTINGQVRVRVKVSVDRAGRVDNAEFDSVGPSRYFANLALKAARQWEFAPAMLAGEPAPSQWLIGFTFRRSGTEVEPRLLTAASAKR